MKRKERETRERKGERIGDENGEWVERKGEEGERRERKRRKRS